LSSVFYQFFYPLFVLKIKQKPDTPYTNVGYGVSDQTDAKVLRLWVGYRDAIWRGLGVLCLTEEVVRTYDLA
jgi:hypothetical protein